VALLGQTAAQGISFSYLAKMILFLEFISYLSLISAPHTNFLKSLFENMFDIVHLDLIPNVNQYLFKIRENSAAYGYTKERARNLDVGAFLSDNASWELPLLTVALTVFSFFSLLSGLNIIGPYNCLTNSSFLRKLKFSVVTISINEYLFFGSMTLGSFTYLQGGGSSSVSSRLRILEEETGLIMGLNFWELLCVGLSVFLLIWMIKEEIDYFRVINERTAVKKTTKDGEEPEYEFEDHFLIKKIESKENTLKKGGA
jgi:hypothetical protein